MVWLSGQLSIAVEIQKVIVTYNQLSPLVVVSFLTVSLRLVSGIQQQFSGLTIVVETDKNLLHGKTRLSDTWFSTQHWSMIDGVSWHLLVTGRISIFRLSNLRSQRMTAVRPEAKTDEIYLYCYIPKLAVHHSVWKAPVKRTLLLGRKKYWLHRQLQEGVTNASFSSDFLMLSYCISGVANDQH